MLDREIINALLDIKAVELRVDKENWFTWASGIKSPIYCDNRLTMSYPKIRKQIAEGFVKKIKELYPNVDYIVGTATAGIPHAAWISDIMDLPMLYVRGSAKDHGKTNQIEGKYEKGKKSCSNRRSNFNWKVFSFSCTSFTRRRIRSFRSNCNI